MRDETGACQAFTATVALVRWIPSIMEEKFNSGDSSPHAIQGDASCFAFDDVVYDLDYRRHCERWQHPWLRGQLASRTRHFPPSEQALVSRQPGRAPES